MSAYDPARVVADLRELHHRTGGQRGSMHQMHHVTRFVVVHRDDASRITRDDVVHGAAVCLDCATAFDATAWGMP